MSHPPDHGSEETPVALRAEPQVLPVLLWIGALKEHGLSTAWPESIAGRSHGEYNLVHIDSSRTCLPASLFEVVSELYTVNVLLYAT